MALLWNHEPSSTVSATAMAWSCRRRTQSGTQSHPQTYSQKKMLDLQVTSRHHRYPLDPFKTFDSLDSSGTHPKSSPTATWMCHHWNMSSGNGRPDLNPDVPRAPANGRSDNPVGMGQNHGTPVVQSQKCCQNRGCGMWIWYIWCICRCEIVWDWPVPHPFIE